MLAKSEVVHNETSACSGERDRDRETETETDRDRQRQRDITCSMTLLIDAAWSGLGSSIGARYASLLLTRSKNAVSNKEPCQRERS